MTERFDRIIKLLILMVLLMLLYIELPVTSRFTYKINNNYGVGVFLLDPGETPIAISGPNMIVRIRRW